MAYSLFRIIFLHIGFIAIVGILSQLIPGWMSLALLVLAPVYWLRRRHQAHAGYLYHEQFWEIRTSAKTTRFTVQATPQRFKLFLAFEVIVMITSYVILLRHEALGRPIQSTLRYFFTCVIGDGADVTCY